MSKTVLEISADELLIFCEKYPVARKRSDKIDETPFYEKLIRSQMRKDGIPNWKIEKFIDFYNGGGCI